jgi:hypothetical protein
MIADAYRGKEISKATWDFLAAAAGQPGELIEVLHQADTIRFYSGGSADVVAYVGHNGLMDFALTNTPAARDDKQRKAIVLACASKSYFAPLLRRTGAEPLIWTTNLMAPEAYVLSAALDGWIDAQHPDQIRQRVARAYHSYQHCGLNAANRLFAAGW